MIKNIRHTGIVVDNLEESLHFYVDLLGFTITKRMDESGAYIDNMLCLKDTKVTTIKMSISDNQMLELLHFQSHPGGKKKKNIIDVGLTHIAFNVANLDNEYTRLKNANVPFSCPPQLSPDGFAKVTFCQAPEGTHIELVEVL